MAGSYERDGTLNGRRRRKVADGTRFGAWTFLGFGEGYRYRVRCICGEDREVRSQDLRNGLSSSCGCLADPPNLAGIGRSNITHGTDYGSKLYRTWRNAKNRVFNPSAEKYATYGSKGIDMDPEWASSFEKFAAHLGEPPSPKHSLDRIDNTKGYWPGNIRWATVREQIANRSNTLRITFEGRTLPLTEWCEMLGLKKNTARHRLRAGWSAKDILFGKESSNVSDQRRTHRGPENWRNNTDQRASVAGVPAG